MELSLHPHTTGNPWRILYQELTWPDWCVGKWKEIFKTGGSELTGIAQTKDYKGWNQHLTVDKGKGNKRLWIFEGILWILSNMYWDIEGDIEAGDIKIELKRIS